MTDLSPLWCADDTPHAAHSAPNEFGGTNHCTGRFARPQDEAVERIISRGTGTDDDWEAKSFDGWTSVEVASYPRAAAQVINHLLRRTTRGEPTAAELDRVRKAIHRALAPSWMSVVNALGGSQDEYDAMLDTIADTALRAAFVTSEAS